MTKQITVSFYIFLVSVLGISQNEQEFLGAIKLSDSTLISYKLVFNMATDNSIKGYSITDLGGEHETKSNIIGAYDTKSKILNFREESIIYTKSPVSQLDFCFIHFYSDTFRYDKSKKLSGVFTGKFSDNTQCIDGEIRLEKSEKVYKRVEKISKIIDKSKRIPDSIKQRVKPLKIMDNLNMNVLKEKEVMSVFSNQNEIQLVLYDGGQEDGDVVSIFVNGKNILNKHKITAAKQILKIPLSSKKTRIVVKAESVGTISTNTAVLEFNDSVNNIRALTNLKLGETTTIDILKQ